MEADDHGRSQAAAQFESIVELVAELNAARKAEADLRDADECTNAAQDRIEAAETAIRNKALSVEVRSNWYGLFGDSEVYNEEFRILLCWGGPAVQIVGKLSEHNEPESAWLEYQDWGILWTTIQQSHADRQILVQFAQTFYFGE